MMLYNNHNLYKKLTSAIFLLLFMALPTFSQETLSLDSCRAMALRNNKQVNIARLKQDVTKYTHKAAKTKYLPHVDIMGGYEFTSRPISLLNNDQKVAFSNLGTTAAGQLGNSVSSVISEMAGQGIINSETANALGNIAQNMAPELEQAGNSIGQSIRDAFKTDTRNFFAASIMLTQPLYMGGGITAMNKIAEISEDLAANDIQNQTQNILYNIDNTYWTVVSLKHKEQLATSYLELVQKLSDDVQKMIAEGVATKADGLKVEVKVNEAEMQLTQVSNGLALAKMLLCQLCGIPISKDIVLDDEDRECISDSSDTPQADIDNAIENRPELRMLQNSIDISKQSTRLIRAEYLPQVALTAGYLITNPSVFNGFEKRFEGIWNVGIMVRMPVWNWFEGTYKIRASKAATNIAAMEFDDACESVTLQVNQGVFKVSEAEHKLSMASKNTEHADENLRCANLGFSEGVMDVTDVMAAQTAWLQARSQKIDAEIDVKLTQINLKKVLGDSLY